MRRRCPCPRALARALARAVFDIGWVALERITFTWDKSILDCEPSDIEEPSEDDNGGVSPPELDVQVLDREREAGPGREKTGIVCTGKGE